MAKPGRSVTSQNQKYYTPKIARLALAPKLKNSGKSSEKLSIVMIHTLTKAGLDFGDFTD
jgi:hypothetical protein